MYDRTASPVKTKSCFIDTSLPVKTLKTDFHQRKTQTSNTATMTSNAQCIVYITDTYMNIYRINYTATPSAVSVLDTSAIPQAVSVLDISTTTPAVLVLDITIIPPAVSVLDRLRVAPPPHPTDQLGVTLPPPPTFPLLSPTPAGYSHRQQVAHCATPQRGYRHHLTRR